MSDNYDALLLLSYGGPENMADVVPFLENVSVGKYIPRERLLEVAEHYTLLDGVSPINAQNRALIEALERQLKMHGPNWPVYFGNRNWHPLLADTIRQMMRDNIGRALVFVTSAFSSYSGCRQYLKDIELARQQVGPDAPQLDKLRAFYNHPGFIEPMAQRVVDAIETIPTEHRDEANIIFTAHSIPLAMAQDCDYEAQLIESCRLVAQTLHRSDWTLVYQSRSGPPTQRWLDPDICDYLEQLHDDGAARHVVIVPIGFISDHMEVVFDLDTEAKEVCDRLGLNMVRAATVGMHPRFVTMIHQLIEERITPNPRRLALGTLGPRPDVCPHDCCAVGQRAHKQHADGS